MNRLVFLLEEASMKELLDGLLPRIFPNLKFICIAHQGKSDLERSIPRKLKAWRNPGDSFVVVRDNDNGDCHSLKLRLLQLCRTSGRSDAVVRIVCQELEAWYLGDPDAVAQAFDEDSILNIKNKRAYRNPDSRNKPSLDLKKLIPQFQKPMAPGGWRSTSRERAIAPTALRSSWTALKGCTPNAPEWLTVYSLTRGVGAWCARECAARRRGRLSESSPLRTAVRRSAGRWAGPRN